MYTSVHIKEFTYFLFNFRKDQFFSTKRNDTDIGDFKDLLVREILYDVI